MPANNIPPPSLTSLVASLKGEPGLWSISPVPIPAAPPAGDATETHHGKGEKPLIPSYENRMRITIAVDTVRMYNLAYDLPTADQKILTSAAGDLYQQAHLGTIPQAVLLSHILGHWPIPPPSLWLLRIVNAVCAYKTALMLPNAPNDPAVALAKAALLRAVAAIDGIGDGVGASAGGGH
jgi:hypothetical protein